ncbi:MAG: hypothetical protein E7161_01670 [Firmicutes bacterium]|nr:hypothetical protein [Bacillota bacterium]
MENQKNNKGVIALLVVIIVILSILCVLFATGTISFKSSNVECSNNNSNNATDGDSNGENKFEDDEAIAEEIELKSEVDAINHGNSSEELVEYKTYIKNNKLYAKNLKTNEEKMIFDKEPVKNIATRPVCCAGSAYLLILTTDGNVYMSEQDINYQFSFEISFEKLEAKDIVSFKLMPVSGDYVSHDLYGIDSNGKETLLHKIN